MGDRIVRGAVGDPPPESRSRGARFLPLIGTVLAAIPVLSWAALGPVPLNERVALLISGVFALAALAGSAWLIGSGQTFRSGGMARIVAWSLGGVGLLTGIILVIILAGPAKPLSVFVNYGSLGASLGAAMGLLVGTIEARAIHRARESERLRSRTERAEAERERLDHLNAMLRHEVLNGINVIKGSADLAIERDAARPPVRRRLETISGRADRIASTITDVRVLLDAVTDDLNLRPVDLTAAIEREVENLRDLHPSAEVDVDVATDLAVLADVMLCRVFANVLSNAVEHNDGEDPRVSVFAERRPEATVVRVADNGPGIPPERRETIFERGQGDHGLGLHLVRSLVTRYGGTIEVTETGPDGTTISITLPPAGPGAVDEESRSETSSPDVEARVPA